MRIGVSIKIRIPGKFKVRITFSVRAREVEFIFLLLSLQTQFYSSNFEKDFFSNNYCKRINISSLRSESKNVLYKIDNDRASQN